MMKLEILVGLFLIFNTVNSASVDITEKIEEGTEAAILDIGEIPGEIPEELLEGMEDNTTIDMDGEGTKPNAYFLEEVKEYFQQPKSRSRIARQSNGVLYHGNTIALQTFVRSYWLGCSATYCGRASCPLMLMMGTDWTNCWGEVFRIYRANGPGAVRVGDLVGLYYPRQGGTWLGCSISRCAKATCPGYPTTAYGFATQEKWFQCWGEVFKIYARGKGAGALINSNDDIALYYLQDQLWVAQGYNLDAVKFPCLGRSRPPPLHRYDGCAFETFRVWKR